MISFSEPLVLGHLKQIKWTKDSSGSEQIMRGMEIIQPEEK